MALELGDIVLLLGFQVVFSGLFAIITTVALGWWYGQALLSVKMGGLSPKGVESRLQKAERQQQAMLEFATAIQKEGADPVQVLKEVGLKYPDVATDFIRKGIKLAGEQT